MDAKIESQKLLSLLNSLRLDKKITLEETGRRTNIYPQNLKRLFDGKYSPSLETLIKLSDAIGYEVILVDKDSESGINRNYTEPKFMLVPDDENKQLYILHRHFPACLILVKQETPVRFIIQDLYDDVDSVNDLVDMPFVQQAKDFFFEYLDKNLNKN